MKTTPTTKERILDFIKQDIPEGGKIDPVAFEKELDELEGEVRKDERESIRNFLTDWKALDTGIGAIPETTDYANGWNECRKKAHRLRNENIDYYLHILTTNIIK